MIKRFLRPVIIVILVIIIVFGGYLLYLKIRGSKQFGTAPTGSYQLRTTPTPKYALYAKESSLLVSPVNAGNTVEITKAVLAVPGYVVVSTLKNNLPDLVLGHSELLKGENSNVKIKLIRDLSKGEQIFVGLNSDDGDGQFEYPGKDIPIFYKNTVPYGFLIGVK